MGFGSFRFLSHR
uniref:Uncharacterized protein n=1 Tax=Rhizophora mucronata TaxID=61149 RepID=A0A2P2JLK5_RHIMU